MAQVLDINLLIFEIFNEIVDNADNFFTTKEKITLFDHQQIILDFVYHTREYSSKFCIPDLHNLLKKVEKSKMSIDEMDVVDIAFNIAYSIRTAINYIQQVEAKEPDYFAGLVNSYEKNGNFKWNMFYDVVKLIEAKELDARMYDDFITMMRPVLDPDVYNALILPDNRELCIDMFLGFGQFRRQGVTHASLMECFDYYTRNRDLECSKFVTSFVEYLRTPNLHRLEKELGEAFPKAKKELVPWCSELIHY